MCQDHPHAPHGKTIRAAVLRQPKHPLGVETATLEAPRNNEVLGDFGAKKVTLLRADWTRRDPAITAALAQLGRNGVPVYVLYQAGRAPVVLSEILSVTEVRKALATL